MTQRPRYYDRTFNRPAVKIQPGELHVTSDDVLITTVLGSCVSVCVRDAVAGVGGMNHFMLPGGEEKEGESPRYGSHAMEQLIEWVLSLGGRAERLEAKVFGAGKINRALPDVGKRNVEFALDYLRGRNIPVTAIDVGEAFPRKVCFSPRCGRVFVKALRNIHDAPLPLKLPPIPAPGL